MFSVFSSWNQSLSFSSVSNYVFQMKPNETERVNNIIRWETFLLICASEMKIGGFFLLESKDKKLLKDSWNFTNTFSSMLLEKAKKIELRFLCFFVKVPENLIWNLCFENCKLNQILFSILIIGESSCLKAASRSILKAVQSKFFYS